MPSNKTSQVFFTYVLRSLKDDYAYVGYTDNLKKRLEEHQKGKSFATRLRRPFKLIYFEACLNEQDAKQREKYLKTTNGRRFLIKRLKHYRAKTVWHLW
ncbi:MAG: GIY-YIG nuclease family protein [Patescibacteria group bacterium]|nr:GIY-YIG nuclease family protein [Patescibacteria group bacterium]MDD5121101.1 GIY-YIG nuclease family protein [Patescibacteria group bacterium]MDD5221927.1 GIY-YIG nuclease family protein [Patescibacteria group bacterium]MDD5395980.1 GIY-YIG nuclease family protein [Patescibacteria group bacterium]